MNSLFQTVITTPCAEQFQIMWAARLQHGQPDRHVACDANLAIVMADRPDKIDNHAAFSLQSTSLSFFMVVMDGDQSGEPTNRSALGDKSAALASEVLVHSPLSTASTVFCMISNMLNNKHTIM